MRNRLSIGIVVNREYAAALGNTPEERLARAIAIEPPLNHLAGTARRVTSVATYSNYQLISRIGHGPGWVLLGDALGFVDPMLSPGVSLALSSAEMLSDALEPLIRRRSPDQLAAATSRYAAAQMGQLDAWSRLVGYFYDGRMAAMMRAGRNWMDHGSSVFKLAAQNHIERHIALQASGVGTTSRYSRALLQFMGTYGLRGEDPAELAIR